jgi:pantetheine-phosphate adenylyltransferase
MLNSSVAVYPGTFDPITNGHLDIIQRASKMFSRLIIGVASNETKTPLFSIADRLLMVEEAIKTLKLGKGAAVLEVKPLKVLLLDFVKEVGARAILRGLRAVSDFEYEFQMAGMNSVLCSDIETVFLMASEGCQFISSRMVKEIAHFGGDVRSFVPDVVVEKLAEKK